jgi:hypothetical protein
MAERAVAPEPIEESLESYRDEVEKLDRKHDREGSTVSARDLLAVFVARDRIAHLLYRGQQLAPARVQLLAMADGQLRRVAGSLRRDEDRETLAAWKHSMDPASERWWWSLHQRPAKLPGWVVTACLLLLGASLTITADIVGLALKVAAVSAGVTAVLLQSLLLYVAGRGLTSSGPERIQHVLVSLPVVRGWSRARHAASIGIVTMAALIFVLAGLARWGGPGWMATYYRGLGHAARDRGAWYQAIEQYDRAAILDPDDPETHHVLAVAHDRTRQFERAIVEYEAVAAIDSADVEGASRTRHASAILGLARLHILHRQEPAVALALLRRVDIRHLQGGARHTFLTTRGWAKLELDLHADAEGDLKSAIAVDDRGPAARYLLGRTLKALGRPADARVQYRKMIENLQADPTRELEVEPAWIIEAQRQLLQADGT